MPATDALLQSRLSGLVGKTLDEFIVNVSRIMGVPQGEAATEAALALMVGYAQGNIGKERTRAFVEKVLTAGQG